MKILIFIPVFLAALISIPQSSDSGQYPPGMNWHVIDTLKYRLVFPLEMEEEAQRAANILDSTYEGVFSGRPSGKRITLFLPNCGIHSNGFIQLAPRKGQFNVTPPQSGFNGNTGWYATLALHEGKHVDQFERLDTGFTKIGGWIFGDLGRAGLYFFSVPQWFFEGESVYTETVFSSGGRGRLPSFSMGTRAILLSGKEYGYTKSYLSSYRDHVPDIYKLGYFLTTWLKNNLSGDDLEQVLKISSRYSFYPFIFSHALKTVSGRGLGEIYRQVMDELKGNWERTDQRLRLSDLSRLNRKKKRGWTLYTSPRVSSDGSIVAQKYGISHPLSLVMITPDGREKKLTSIKTVDHINNSLSVNNGRIVWSEPVPDPRWAARSYSEIILYDIKTGKKRRLTRKSRFFSPALSKNGEQIAAVRFSELRRSYITILRSSDGKVVDEFEAPDRSFLRTPSWSGDGKQIVMIRDENGAQAVTVLDTGSRTFMDITPPAYKNLSTPVFSDRSIIYGSSLSGIDNIYATDIQSRERSQLTSSRFGAFFPEISPDKKKLVYCDYNSEGMDIVSAPFDTGNRVPLENIVIRPDHYFQNPGLNTIGLTRNDGRSLKKYPVKKYNFWSDLIHFHSRAFIPDRVEPSFEIYSANRLNTTFITGGFSYNTNERKGKFYSEAVYAGLFPVIKAGFSRSGRSAGYPEGPEWNETEMSLSLSLPLDFSRGAYTRRVSAETGLAKTRISGSGEEPGSPVKNGDLTAISLRFSFLNFKSYSKRDLSPPLAQTLSAAYQHSLRGHYYRGEKWSVNGALFFPGIFPHHSLRLGFSYEKQSPVNYLFASDVSFSRGYDYEFNDNLVFGSLDYSFPVGYPDLAFGDLIYIKRVKSSLFLDLGRGSGRKGEELYHSAGIELKADLNIFSLPVEIEAGVRFSYRFNDASIRVEPLFIGIGF